MQERDVVSGMAVFVAVVEGGSLAAAARRTGLTPSAVSKLITRLEKDFSAPLLRRTTRSLTVTDAGQTFFERARTILDELRAVEQEMASQSSSPRGRLRVTAPQLLGQMAVLPSLLAFLKKTPAVTLDFDLTDRTVDMVAERVDIAVRITSDPPPSFVARRVGVIRRVLCASPAYLRARGTPRAPADLAEHACLRLSGHGNSELWQLGNDKHGAVSVRVLPRLRASGTLSLYEAAKAGLGIADLPGYLVADDLRARRLVSVLESFEPTPRGVFVIYPAGPLIPVRAREAAVHLIRELKQQLE
jgi:DNA-binding transcriptional LysR family regulator